MSPQCSNWPPARPQITTVSRPRAANCAVTRFQRRAYSCSSKYRPMSGRGRETGQDGGHALHGGVPDQLFLGEANAEMPIAAGPELITRIHHDSGVTFERQRDFLIGGAQSGERREQIRRAAADSDIDS